MCMCVLICTSMCTSTYTYAYNSLNYRLNLCLNSDLNLNINGLFFFFLLSVKHDFPNKKLFTLRKPPDFNDGCLDLKEDLGQNGSGIVLLSVMAIEII